ncbi:MAG: methyltransferase domain-containing protein [Leptospiraceae bacterium]|nr:methyltransferase domain-containing protein [Leptospiraceae bacterium]
MKRIKRIYKKLFARKIKFSEVTLRKEIFLYAGDVPEMEVYNGYVGLSINQEDERHIKHDVTNNYPISDNSVDRYQSEDVFEHIEYEELPKVINEIYRVLKVGGLFRLALPDYRCDILYDRTHKNEQGELQFDPQGGGAYLNGKVVNGGHVWFPNFEKVSKLLEKSKFSKIEFLHYYDSKGNPVTNPIDYSKGWVIRTPDHDDRVKNPYRPISIVVDCIK